MNKKKTRPRHSNLNFRPWFISTKGKLIRASDYGHKAFPMWFKKRKKR